MLKIVYLTDQVYLHGGVEKVLTQKLNYLANDKGVEVFLITTEQKQQEPCYAIDSKVKQIDLAINYERTKSYLHPVNLVKVPRHIKKLKRVLNAIQPDVLIVCNYAFDFYVIPFISKGIKIIKEYHTSRYNEIQQLVKASFFIKLKFQVATYFEKKYSYVVVLNEDEKNYYKSANAVVIPNSIQPPLLDTSITKKPVIIAAGRIAPVKQFEQLLQAWSIIETQFPDWEVHIYGDGNVALLEELKQVSQALKLGAVYFKGATNQLNAKMQEASIYALTSQTECFPMVLLEALSNGLPIVAYDCPHGPKHILQQGVYGVLVNPMIPDNFAAALANLIEDEVKRNWMAAEGCKHVQQYSEEIIMQKWLHLFQKNTIHV